MLAALNPSGTIHVTGVGSNRGGLMGNPNSTTISVGMMSTDFKSTMKHNSSNNSIHRKENMLSTIRKPTDFVGLTTSSNIKKGGNYMSPYSQKMVATKNNSNHNMQ